MDDRIKKIKQYLKCYNPWIIERVLSFKNKQGEANDIYYRKDLIETTNYFDKNLSSDAALKSEKRLFSFNREMQSFESNLFKLLRNLEKYRTIEKSKKDAASNGVVLAEIDLIHSLNNLEYISQYIKKLQSQEKYITSIKAQDYVLYRIKSFILHYKSWYQIDIYKTPIAKDFKRIIKEIKASVNLDKISILKEGKANVIREPLTETHLDWKGKPTELIEVIKALIESQVFSSNISEKLIFEEFQRVFKTNLTNYPQNLTKIRNRVKEETPFINKLQMNLSRWIKKDD